MDDSIAHGQVGQLLGHPDAEVVAGGPARVGQRESRGPEGGLELGHLGAETLDPVVGRHELVEPGRAAPGPLE